MARTAEVLSHTIADTTPRAAAERCMIINLDAALSSELQSSSNSSSSSSSSSSMTPADSICSLLQALSLATRISEASICALPSEYYACLVTLCWCTAVTPRTTRALQQEMLFDVAGIDLSIN
eukprot:8279-Heterococcus_DN1.PRE.2